MKKGLNLLVIFRPRYLPISEITLNKYRLEIDLFLEKVCDDLFHQASSMNDAIIQNDLIGLIEKVKMKTISVDQIEILNELLRFYGYYNWIFSFNRK